MAQLLNRLRNFRQLMKANHLAMYFLPNTDEHQSEYLTKRDERVQYISAFTGSNAHALISHSEALLWTDPRYYLQALSQLPSQWNMKRMESGQMKWSQYLVQHYSKDTSKVIGFDPKLITAQQATKNTDYFSKHGFQFKAISHNLIDTMREKEGLLNQDERLPAIYSHEEWSGKSIEDKLQWVRANMREKNGLSAIFNELSEISWLLNLRSSQIPHTPFFKSTLVVNLTDGFLYLPTNHPSLHDIKIQAHLKRANILMKQEGPLFSQRSLINKAQLNYFIYSQIAHKEPVEWEGIGLYRAVRSPKQIQGFRRCHLLDGVAMARFWGWRAKAESVNQYECAMKMDGLRYEQQNNKGLSFDTISGVGANSAIIHYRPTAASSSAITKEMIHLVDSGGQYLNGTTDVTRTFHFGQPTQQQKDSYTRVLLGNLDVQRLRWPANQLTGSDIDILARRHLWKNNKDYPHSTGHGVGYFQSVHEGPVGISKSNKTILRGGMIVTNEPGYYEAGRYGIRIQNMLLVVQKEGFNYFQVLTLCPYDKNLMERSLLNEEDIKHINQYHKRVQTILLPLLTQYGQARQWIIASTSPL